MSFLRERRKSTNGRRLADGWRGPPPGQTAGMAPAKVQFSLALRRRRAALKATDWQIRVNNTMRAALPGG